MSLDIQMADQPELQMVQPGLFSDQASVAAPPADPWAEWTGYGRLHGAEPTPALVGDVMYAPTMLPSSTDNTNVAMQFAQGLGLDPTQALNWYMQGVSNPIDPGMFAGATDTGNWNLRPGLGIANIAQQSGNWSTPLADQLNSWVEQGYQDMNLRREMDKQKQMASLGQFVGMLGSATIPGLMGMYPGMPAGSGILGNVGGALARAGVGGLSAGLGGGNPLMGIASGLAPAGLDASGLSGMLSNVNPAVRALAENAVSQFAGSGTIDPRGLALAGAGAGLDYLWNEGPTIFGSDSAASMQPVSGGASFQPDLDGLLEDMDAVSQPIAQGGYYQVPGVTGLTPQRMAESGLINPAEAANLSNYLMSIDFGALSNTPQFTQEQSAEEAAPPQPTQQFDPEAIGSEQGPTTEPVSSLKPSSLLKLLVGVAGLFGENEASEEARGVYEAEYASDAERRQAYLDYANRVFAAIPEIADAYDPKAYGELTQFGRVEIDPATGEARFVPNPEAQASIDQLIDAADKVVDQILDTDTSKLSADEFQKALATLQASRDKNFNKLMRVLYARGLLGLATYGEAFDNPFTGRTESYLLEEGQAANPYMAAYQSGIERENAELAGQSMNSADDFIDQLIGQSSNLSGQLGARSGNMIDAILGAQGRYGDIVDAGQARGNALSQLLQSPAGLFGGNAATTLAAEDYMSEEERRRLLAMMQGGI